MADERSSWQGAHPEPAPDPDADARALASSLRVRILRMCLDTALTNREIAERLGRNPATVLHHVRTLVDRGFLAAEPVRRGTRGAREVPYRATGRSWRVSPGLAAGAVTSRVLVDALLADLAETDPAAVETSRLGVRLSEAEVAELRGRLHALLAEYADRAPTPGGTPWSVFLALHPDPTRD